MANAPKKMKILVVDDQEAFLQAVIDEVTFLGYETLSAKNGQEAFDVAKSTKVDLILSDIRMPNKDGRWFLNELRKVQKASPPFIFMTGFADLSIQDAYAMGVDGFLAKPLNPEKMECLAAKLCLPIEARWTTTNSEKPIHHISKNYSMSALDPNLNEIKFGRGGMYLFINKLAFQVGDYISFNLQFQGAPLNLLEGTGTIVWKKENPEGIADEYGLFFESLSEEANNQWLAFLKSSEMVEVIPNGTI